MIGVASLRRWSPEVLREVAHLLIIRSCTVEGVVGRVAVPEGAWTGAAATAADESADLVRGLLRGRADQLSALGRAFEAAAERVTQVVLDLRAIERSLEADRFVLTDDGSVLDVATSDPSVQQHWSATERAEQQRRAAADVQALLAMAEDVDRCLATAVTRVMRGGVSEAAAVLAARPPGSRDAELRTRARQAVGVVGAATFKWGHGPVLPESRRRYDEEEAFATQVDDYADHNDAGMLARDVLLSTGDGELARWTYEHPYEWAHEAAPAESPDGAPYVMDVPVAHSPRTQWARAATAVGDGYLQLVRPGRPAPSLARQAETLKRDASAFWSGPMNHAFARLDEQATSISEGHSFDKHVLGLDARGVPRHTPDLSEIATRDELADKTASTMWRRARVSLKDGRAYHLDPADGHIVITNPRAADQGTSFRITQQGYERRLLAQDAEARARGGHEPGVDVTLPPSMMETRYLMRNPLWQDYEKSFVTDARTTTNHVVTSFTGQIGTGGFAP